MIFLIDEDVPVEVARSLGQAGHEVLLAAKVLGRGTPDSMVWQFAVEKSATVVTCNRMDFPNLAGKSPATGLIIPQRRLSRQAECRSILELVSAGGESGLSRNINFA